MAKCENCYHYEACLNSLSENKVLNNTEVFACEHYKDKSLIVELPCRVGDKVYRINALGKIEECTVEEICINAFNNLAVLRRTKGNRSNIGSYLKYIGKTVFFSREEAERALEERE